MVKRARFDYECIYEDVNNTINENQNYTIKCTVNMNHINTINIHNIPTTLGCDYCNISLAKIIYLFTNNYDLITQILLPSISNKDVKFELGKYVTLLHKEELSFEVESNGYLYKRNNNFYNKHKLHEYFGDIDSNNMYYYCKYFLEINDFDNFIKYNKDPFLLSRYFSNTKKYRQLLELLCEFENIYSISNCKSTYNITIFNHIYTKSIIFELYPLFISEISNFLKTFLNDNIQYYDLTDEIQNKICEYLNLLDPFKYIIVSNRFESITKQEIILLSNYIKYMSINDQFYLLCKSYQENINNNNIIDQFVIINKKDFQNIKELYDIYISSINLKSIIPPN